MPCKRRFKDKYAGSSPENASVVRTLFDLFFHKMNASISYGFNPLCAAAEPVHRPSTWPSPTSSSAPSASCHGASFAASPAPSWAAGPWVSTTAKTGNRVSAAGVAPWGRCPWPRPDSSSPSACTSSPLLPSLSGARRSSFVAKAEGMIFCVCVCVCVCVCIKGYLKKVSAELFTCFLFIFIVVLFRYGA